MTAINYEVGERLYHKFLKFLHYPLFLNLEVIVLRLKASLERVSKRMGREEVKAAKHTNFQEFCCKENREVEWQLQGNVDFTQDGRDIQNSVL